MVIVILIILISITIWLLSLKYAEKIGDVFIDKVINPIKNLFN